MKTAVQWLQEVISIHFTFEQQMQFEGLFQQAKEMEKQDIIDAVEWNYKSNMGEVYYKATFNKQ
jgi:hypothetical protein